MSAQERLTASLADRYRLARALGASGMDTVYLAHDLKHERDVAIKVLHHREAHEAVRRVNAAHARADHHQMLGEVTSRTQTARLRDEPGHIVRADQQWPTIAKTTLRYRASP